MKRDGVLILGGGFIGSALARRLAADGKTVHVMTRGLSDIARDARLTVHQGELADRTLLEELLPNCGTVVHAASATLPGSSARHPVHELDNLAPTLHLLDALQTCQDTHILFLSSGGTVHGNPRSNPVPEDAVLAPLSYHGAGKVAMEAFFQVLRNAGHAVTILRPSNAYGVGQKLTTGFGLIRTLLEHARNGDAVEIWGDGENVRDFVYIDDVVEACARFIELPDDSDTYNLGCGVGHSINQVLHLIEVVCKTELKKIYRPTRKTDVRQVVLDVSHLRERVAWKPSVALEEGISRTWAWLQKQ